MDSDTMMADIGPDLSSDTRHFVVAVDFGTTFSSVAYTYYTNPSQRSRITLQQVEVVDKYPLDPYGSHTCHDVPTELWYSERLAQPSYSDMVEDETSIAAENGCSGDNPENAQDTDDSSDDMPDQTVSSSSDPSAKNKSVSLFWGYEVQEKLRELNYETGHSRHLSRFKLMLDQTQRSEKIRSTLSDTFKTLKKLLLIESEVDVIAHYLEQLFKHTRKILVTEGYTSESTIEFVLCVPAIWKSKACRYMKQAMVTAIAQSGLGDLQNGSIDNLFLVSEPEAAAACVLASNKTRLTIGETFILLDAGGGTVDAITYTVDQQTPLRLKTEEVNAGGALCGSSFINERFEDLLIQRLKNETYLERDGESILKIINGLVVEFEQRDKKKLDQMFPNVTEPCTIRIQGLRENRKNRFMVNRLILSPSEIKGLFMPSLEGVADVMMDQFRTSQQKGRQVQKIILVGGFGQSQSLSSHLSERLRRECDINGVKVMLDASRLQSSAVAYGAVMRALRKEDGPARILQSSYGFLRSEPYLDHDAHCEQDPKLDKLDGHKYIDNTIDWIVCKGDVLDSEERIVRNFENTFSYKRKLLLCNEILYVSDHAHESHYRRDHEKNKGAEQAAVVKFDLTYLRTQGKITPVRARPPYWKIKAVLVIFVSGRNLRYEVRWPDENGEVVAIGQESLAPAFKPGTE